MKFHDEDNGKESKLANPTPTNKSQLEEPVGILTLLLVELVKKGMCQLMKWQKKWV